MSTSSVPTPEEIAAVLAASEPVREALRRVAGPGWAIPINPLVRAAHTDGDGVVRPPLREQVAGLAVIWAWLPVSEVAIAEAAAKAAGVGVNEIGIDWWGEPPAWDVGLGGSSRARAVASSARLAALRVLIAVLAPAVPMTPRPRAERTGAPEDVAALRAEIAQLRAEADDCARACRALGVVAGQAEKRERERTLAYLRRESEACAANGALPDSSTPAWQAMAAALRMAADVIEEGRLPVVGVTRG